MGWYCPPFGLWIIQLQILQKNAVFGTAGDCGKTLLPTCQPNAASQLCSLCRQDRLRRRIWFQLPLSTCMVLSCMAARTGQLLRTHRTAGLDHFAILRCQICLDRPPQRMRLPLKLSLFFVIFLARWVEGRRRDGREGASTLNP